MHHNVEILLD